MNKAIPLTLALLLATPLSAQPISMDMVNAAVSQKAGEDGVALTQERIKAMSLQMKVDNLQQQVVTVTTENTALKQQIEQQKAQVLHDAEVKAKEPMKGADKP